MENYDGHSALLVLGVGLGKTFIFSSFIKNEVLEKDHTVLILSHREELVRHPQKYLEGIPFGIEMSDLHADPRCHKVISASVQTMARRLQQYNPREIDTIIIDEAHHAVAPTYRKIINHFPYAKIFGFTATTRRYDEIGLGAVFTDLIFERDTLWGIKNNYLCPIECHQVLLKYNMESVKIVNGDFSAKGVAEALSGTAEGVVEAYEKFGRGQTLIFAASIAEAKDISKIINQRSGQQIAVAITSSTSNRQKYLDDYVAGKIKCITNFGIFTEGTDLPSTETVIIARPIAKGNVGLYAQMVGRALRTFPGKESACIIDCIGISDSPICTAATLIGKDLPKDTEKESKEKEHVPKKVTTITEKQRPKTWIKNISEIKVMEKELGIDFHNLSFLKMQNGGYLLSIPNVTYVISKPLSDGTVYLHRNKKQSKSPMPLQFVLDYVYADLSKKFKRYSHIWDNSKRKYWDKAPISDKQVKLIKKLAPDYEINVSTMTKGDGSMIIQSLLSNKEI